MSVLRAQRCSINSLSYNQNKPPLPPAPLLNERLQLIAVALFDTALPAESDTFRPEQRDYDAAIC